MELNDKIKEIHDSNLFGCFIETGCGMAVASKLFEVAGSSKTIYMAESPYNKAYQHAKYKTGEHRAVSMKNVKTILDTYINSFGAPEGYIDGNSPYNTVYVSSFQVGDETNKTSTHGWIGLWYKGESMFYHVSIHAAMSRLEYLNRISEIGIEILHTTIQHRGTVGCPIDCCVDISQDSNEKDIPVEFMLSSLSAAKEENFLCFKDGNEVRLEDLFRDKKNIILFKGSFNPVHNAHVAAAKMAETKYGTIPIMMIASEIYQKGWVEPSDMRYRIQTLNELGYPVIVTRKGYFNENIAFIRQKFSAPIVFIAGSDTINRIIDSSYKILGNGKYRTASAEEGTPEHWARLSLEKELTAFKKDFNGVTFFVVNRPGYEAATEITDLLSDYCSVYNEVEDFHHISSTKIRELQASNHHDQIKDLVPQKVFDKIVNSSKIETK